VEIDDRRYIDITPNRTCYIAWHANFGCYRNRKQ
jgi:hypothetical protein